MPVAFEMTRRVAFSETDMAGVMHFSNYFRWMEDAECAFWRSLGRGQFTYYDDRMHCWPRISVDCRYRAPLRFEDETLVQLRLTGMTTKTLRFEVDFMQRGEVTAQGMLTIVCCAMRPGGFDAVPIPAELRELLKPLLSPPGSATR